MLALIILVWTCVAYAAMKVPDMNYTYRTHETQYSWEISGAYLSGSVPVACLLVLFLIVLIILVYFANTFFLLNGDPVAESRNIIDLGALISIISSITCISVMTLIPCNRLACTHMIF